MAIEEKAKKQITINAINVLSNSGLNTKEKVIAYHKKHNLLSLRNCGPKTLNAILKFYGLPAEAIYCPKCGRLEEYIK